MQTRFAAYTDNWNMLHFDWTYWRSTTSAASTAPQTWANVVNCVYASPRIVYALSGATVDARRRCGRRAWSDIWDPYAYPPPSQTRFWHLLAIISGITKYTKSAPGQIWCISRNVPNLLRGRFGVFPLLTTPSSCIHVYHDVPITVWLTSGCNQQVSIHISK